MFFNTLRMLIVLCLYSYCMAGSSYQVLIHSNKIYNEPSKPICNGIIVQSRLLLTTAQCLYENAIVGHRLAHEILSVKLVNSNPFKNDLIIRVAQIYIAPNFNSKTRENDLAMVKLERSLPLSRRNYLKWIIIDDYRVNNKNCVTNFLIRNSSSNQFDFIQTEELQLQDRKACGQSSYERKNDICANIDLSGAIDYNAEQNLELMKTLRGTGLLCNKRLVAILSTISPRKNAKVFSLSTIYTNIELNINWLYDLIAYEERQDVENQLYTPSSPFQQETIINASQPSFTINNTKTTLSTIELTTSMLNLINTSNTTQTTTVKTIPQPFLTMNNTKNVENSTNIELTNRLNTTESTITNGTTMVNLNADNTTETLLNSTSENSTNIESTTVRMGIFNADSTTEKLLNASHSINVGTTTVRTFELDTNVVNIGNVDNITEISSIDKRSVYSNTTELNNTNIKKTTTIIPDTTMTDKIDVTPITTVMSTVGVANTVTSELNSIAITTSTIITIRRPQNNTLGDRSTESTASAVLSTAKVTNITASNISATNITATTTIPTIISTTHISRVDDESTGSKTDAVTTLITNEAASELNATDITTTTSRITSTIQVNTDARTEKSENSIENKAEIMNETAITTSRVIESTTTNTVANTSNETTTKGTNTTPHNTVYDTSIEISVEVTNETDYAQKPAELNLADVTTSTSIETTQINTPYDKSNGPTTPSSLNSPNTRTELNIENETNTTHSQTNDTRVLRSPTEANRWKPLYYHSNASHLHDSKHFPIIIIIFTKAFYIFTIVIKSY